jgi:DNA (cytosine-5)-methyltransferase 1
MGVHGRAARRSLKVAGLFAGIGGIELGLSSAGHRTLLLCENDSGAAAVLKQRFPGIDLVGDVRALDLLPAGTDLLAAGFPCQDLSQAGATRGIEGARSGLVTHVFRLLEARRVPWVLLENVPFMLQLGRGAAMNYIADRLEGMGYRWAYRVIDTRAFGLPQRRERVFVLASLDEDPSPRLFRGNHDPEDGYDHRGRACGFYWTEGIRGLGWAVGAVPTLKGGSTIGIPSPPAIWLPDGRFVTPDIRDAERMQGFKAGWTQPAEAVGRAGHRWKLVGNAVTVDVAEWVGERLAMCTDARGTRHACAPITGSWPRAGHGSRDGRFGVEISTWPVSRKQRPIEEFLRYPPRDLSLKAIAGFERRFSSSTLRAPDEFRQALRSRIEQLSLASG